MDSFALDSAIKKAWEYQFLTYPNPAVGASVIVNNTLFVSSHKKAGEAHAEVNVLWEAFSAFHEVPSLKTSHEIHQYLRKHHNGFFKDAKVYVTLEPCSHVGKTPSCAELLKTLKPKSVTIGWQEVINSHAGGAEMLRNSGIEVDVLNDKRCYDLIEPFIKWSEGRFIFYKLAQNLNGAIEGGYISSEESLDWVHKVRDKTDLLIIGGNTVRIDRPTLDSRRIGGKAPDVLILSKNKHFDKTIPLFNVADRKVYISDSLEMVKEYNFIMVEGGEGIYESIKEFVDWKVFILSPTLVNRDNYKLKDRFDVLHVNVAEDLIIFGR